MSLREYHKKRRFENTPEPSGKVKKRKTMRFVVQLHRARAKHYDLRFEYNGVLVSFAVPKGLSDNPKDKRLAVMVEDHPIDYINFEGIIPKGNYGAGTVEIFDKGTYTPLEDFEKSLKNGHIKVLLQGKKLFGVWALVRMEENNWLVIKENDGGPVVQSKKPVKLPFKTQSPQLATLSSSVPIGKNWVFEIKYDGYRVMAFVQGGKAKLLTRNGVDYTKKLANIAKSLEKLDAENFVVDGEVVFFDENGKSDFGKLQNALKNTPNALVFVVFDLLALNGEDLRGKPLLERKKRLEMLVFKARENVVYSSHVEAGKKTFEFAKKNGLEGVVAKKTKSLYNGGRSEDWLKIKCSRRQEFVIGGYVTSEKNEVLSAILVGYYKEKKLVFIGKVGGGFSERDKVEFAQKFKSLIRKTCPFIEAPNVKNAAWLRPSLVAEVEFAEITKDCRLRQPRFVGLRVDKPAKKVVLEE